MNSARRVLLGAVVGAFSIGSIGYVSAADISVCPSECDYTSVQSGIDGAKVGDRVVVGTPGRTSPETYRANIVLLSGVELVSEGDDSTTIYRDPFSRVNRDFTVLKRTTLTILKGAGESAVVSFPPSADTKIDGFIIENVDETASDLTGLVMIGNASPTIKNNIIRDNQGAGISPGIMVFASAGIGSDLAQPIIQNNLIHYINGPGISIRENSYPTVSGNKIFTTPPDFTGHQDMAQGIGLQENASAIIANNELFYNRPFGIGSGSGATLDGSGVGIYNSGNSLIVRDNEIHHHPDAGVSIAGQRDHDTEGVDAIIEGNDFYNNKAGVRTLHENTDGHLGSVTVRNNTFDTHATSINASSVTTLIVEDNEIVNSNMAGMQLQYIRDIQIRNNSIDNSANRAGIALFNQPFHSYTFTIENNTITNSGREGIRLQADVDSGGVVKGNLIDGSGYGGIAIMTAMTVDIIDNEIKNSVRGGLHTGHNEWSTESSPPFAGGEGNLHMVIRGNKVHHNGQDMMGGGIDVRHASGVIENNLVYKNHLSGIRFGDWINAINHNTVVANGTGHLGAGIVYSDLSGPVNELLPKGSPPAAFPIRNNIVVANASAGINAGTSFPDEGMTCDVWIGQRDYNLLSANDGTDEGCGSFAPLCWTPQLANCLGNPGEIFVTPQFVDAANDDYRLQVMSPAVDSGDPAFPKDAGLPPGQGTLSVDMGAYGGSHGINW